MREGQFRLHATKQYFPVLGMIRTYRHIEMKMVEWTLTAVHIWEEAADALQNGVRV